MIANGHGIGRHDIRSGLLGCRALFALMLATIPTHAEDGPPLAGALVEQPLGWVAKHFYRDNAGCVSAKLDVWFWHGRYTHQLFTQGSSAQREITGPRPAAGESAPRTLDLWEGEKLDPTSRQIMDSDSTTVLVGREGCRYRVRIERVD